MSDTTGAEDAARNALEGEEGQPKTFSQEYVHDLREENARWRKQAQAAQAPWAGISEDDQRVWQQLARTYATDPAQAAAWMKDIAKQVAPKKAADPGTEAPITRDEIARLIAERDQNSTQQQLIREIETEARALGYTPGTLDYVDLLWVAENETNADLGAAHTKLQSSRQAWVEQHLTENEAQGRWPRVPRGGSPAAERPKEIKTFDDAKRAMEARLAQLPD